MEFLVHMELKLPETWSSEWIKGMYRREAETCRPYLGNGMFAPGYVDLLGEWIGQPVHHQQWQRRVLRDNDLLHPDYQTALAADRRSWF